jgi:hypothetical protein
MGSVTVRFTGGPAHGLVRELPADPDGRPPRRWLMGHPVPAGGGTAGPVHPGTGPDHLYERARVDGYGTWTMRFVRSDPVGVNE